MTQNIRWFLASSLFLIIVVSVEFLIGWSDILSDWKKISLSQLIVLTILTLVSYLLRSERVYQYFSESHHHRYSYIKISFLHNALNNFLPMRLGEAAFPILMKKEFSESMFTTSAGLFVIRLMDLHVLLLLASIAFMSIHTQTALVSLTILLLTPGLLMFAAPNIIGILPKALVEKASHLFKQNRPLTTKSFQLLTITYLLTIIIWVVKLSALILILMVFLDISFIHGSLAIIAADLSGVLPIHGLAGSGTYEAAMLSALYPLGYDTVAGVKAAINVHIYLLGVSALSIPLALLVPKVGKSNL